MKKQTEIIKTYSWNFKNYGLFQATVSNGELTDLRFCCNGSSFKSDLLWTKDIGFLKCVYKALGEFLKELKVKR